MTRDIDFKSQANRHEFLAEYSDSIDAHGYPECDTILLYDTLDATFIRDEATERGFDGYAQELQTYIDEVLSPLREIDHDTRGIGNFSEEELSILATTQFFRESIGTFTKVNGEIRHGGDIANEFIDASDRDEARERLHEFEDWYREDLDSMLAEVEGEQFDAGPTTYEKVEFGKVALFNGLRMLLDRREKGDPFTAIETRVP